MKKRTVTKISDIKFEPFDNYGPVIPGMNWHRITYNKETGQGTYVLKMEPGSRSNHHIHSGFEEFLVLKGELIDADNQIFKEGDFIAFEPGSSHSSHTKNGCLILVFMRGINKQI